MRSRYSLPELPYGYDEFEPHISQEQLRVHHDKHHKAYVDGANKLLERLEKARSEDAWLDMKALLKELSWQVGGHVLHSLYWENMSSHQVDPEGVLKKDLEKEFGSLDRFRKELEDGAKSVEGSGWMALAYCSKTDRLFLTQIEKHNTNIYPSFAIVMAMDMFEHAYYIDHQNDKGKYIEAFWNVVDWKTVEARLQVVKK